MSEDILAWQRFLHFEVKIMHDVRMNYRRLLLKLSNNCLFLQSRKRYTIVSTDASSLYTYGLNGVLLQNQRDNVWKSVAYTSYALTSSGVARPGPTRVCALPSIFQALPSPAQQKSRDFITNQARKQMHHSSCSASTSVCMQQIANLSINTAIQLTNL